MIPSLMRRILPALLLSLTLPCRAIEPETIRTALELIRFVRNVTPPYALNNTLYLTVEGAYAPLRYLPGKHLSLVNWEMTGLGWSFPQESPPFEAQGYVAAGFANVFGNDSLGEMGFTLNDLRGYHLDFLTRVWLFQSENGFGRLRLTAHAQLAIPTSWTQAGFSSLGTFSRWILPLGGGDVITHLGYVWNGADRSGGDQDDEWHFGTGYRFPMDGGFFGWLTASRLTTASTAHYYLTPNLIWRFFGIEVVGGFSVDLSSTPVHQLHLGLHAFGEPK